MYRDKSYIYLICKRICNVQVLSRDLYSGIEATLANSTRSVTINVKRSGLYITNNVKHRGRTPSFSPPPPETKVNPYLVVASEAN